MNNVLTIYKSISVDFLVQNFHHNIILILPLMKKSTQWFAIQVKPMVQCDKLITLLVCNEFSEATEA